jgi:hypothetical protein
MPGNGVKMQSERIESLKQAKTVTRVNLALCLLCMFSFIGCSCPDWCGNRTYTRNKPWAGPGDGQNFPGINPIDIPAEDLPDFPDKDVIDGLDAVGGPGGIPIREECPNWFCPRKSSGVRVSGGTGFVISSDESGYVISEP